MAAMKSKTGPSSSGASDPQKAKAGKQAGPARSNSAFAELGLVKTVEALKAEIKELYLADEVPWIIGYSGGKDSTAVLQLTWIAISEIPEERRKPVYVISTDTMVENPVVSAWVQKSLDVMKVESERHHMKVVPNRLTPKTENSFWVNLIGKGYPAPRHKFRWCTERLKIKPSNDFINSIVKQNKEAILLLGSRKLESQRRAKVLKGLETAAGEKGYYRTRERLNPNASLPNTLVYTPIEAWSNDDVWMFLMQVRNPWGHDNKELMGMYAGASADGECPLVVDTSTPSCGDSRFGCWVCTLVDEDKSMTAMIQNDAEKEWMAPLLELRNALDFRRMESSNDENYSDRHLRDFRRMRGGLLLFHDQLVHGPYTQETRANWLRKLLTAQTWIREHGPKDVRGLELITVRELEEIRRIWVVEKHELEDLLPRLYRESTGQPYPGQPLDDNLVLGDAELQVLQQICGEDRLHYEMVRELLSVERQQRLQGRRAGLFEQLEKSIGRHYYDSREDALAMARRHLDARQLADQGQAGVAFEDGELEIAALATTEPPQNHDIRLHSS